MHSDPIADTLTKIRNAQAVQKETAEIKFSKMNLAILNILQENGYIEKIEVAEEDVTCLIGSPPKRRKITVYLKYNKKNQSKIQHLKRISKPGRRIYAPSDKLPFVLNGYGLAIISTSKGLMTNKQAQENKLGGEVLCEVF
ncbi:MAG: 30S ribosomal protein S8 [Candidatus Jacksonbacteria bacterium]